MDHIDIRDYGGSTAVDNSGPLNAAMQACLAQGVKRLYVPSGLWNFDSAPNDVPGISIYGDSMSSTKLQLNANGDFFSFFGTGAMGGGLESLALVKGAGFSGGSGIRMVSNNSASPDYADFRSVDVTGAAGTGVWDYGLSIDGTQRTTIQGSRDIKFTNVNLFAGTLGAANLMNIVGCTFVDVSAYPAGGTSANFYIGGGSSTNKFLGMLIEGELNISHSLQGYLTGMVNSLNTDSTASRWFLDGLLLAGPLVNNLQNSTVNLR